MDPITVEEGLPNNNVRCILQDSHGFLWFGTEGGLARYDGHRITSFYNEPENPRSLSHNYITTLHEDASGMLWIGTSGGGLNQFDPETETFTRFRYDPNESTSLTDDEVFALHEDETGLLWVGTSQKGANRFDPKTKVFTQQGMPDVLRRHGASAYDIRAFAQDTSGRLWIGPHIGAVGRLDRTTGQIESYRLDVLDGGNRVRALHVSQSEPSIIWIGTSGGLYRMETSTGRFLRFGSGETAVNRIPQGEVGTIFEDRYGVLWVGTSEGDVSWYSRTEGRFVRFGSINLVDVEDRYAVNDLFEDDSGVLWIGTHAGGLFRYARQKEPFFHYQPRFLGSQGFSSELAFPEIWGIYEDREGILWISTRAGRTWGGGSLDRFDPGSGRIKHFLHEANQPGSLPHNMPAQILEDADRILWVVADGGGGLMRFDQQTGLFRQYTPRALGLLNGSIKTILERGDEPGILWIGTWGDGLGRFDTQSETLSHFRYDPSDNTSLSGNTIHSLYESPYKAGVIWIGTWGSGLSQFEPESGRFMHYQNQSADPTSLSSDFVMAIHASRTEPDILWIGTYNGGLNRLDLISGQFTHFRKRDGLADDNVFSILEDDQGYLWLSSYKGISRFDPRSGGTRNYDVSDGLQSNTFHATAFFQSRRTGEMYFGGDNGLTVFHPDSIGQAEVPPRVALTGLRLSNQAVEIGVDDSPLSSHIAFMDDLVLTHMDRVITFEYATLHYAAPEKNRYRYQLEGFDESWVEAGNRNEVTYTNLDPGKYTFRVMGASRNGNWNTEGTQIRLQVLPPWWRTTVAYFIYGFLLIGAFISVAQVQRRRLIRQERERNFLREKELRTNAAEAWANYLQADNERKELELEKAKELEKAYQALEEQAHRLEEMDQLKSRFFANISHEFRTPLTLLLGPLKDALEGRFGNVDEALQNQHRLMQRNGRRLLHLINQLLDLSRLEAGHLSLRARCADLIPLVKTTVEAFSSMARRKHIAIHLEVPPHEILLYFEADKIEKVCYNLLSNAIKFTHECGTVHVCVAEGTNEETGFVEILFKDTGRGIPTKELPHIFDRFYQVDASSTREHEGTGIGLALTKELVALHGGTIRVESEKGVGAIFTVRLPKGRTHLSDDDLMEVDEPEMKAPHAMLETLEGILTSEEFSHAGGGHAIHCPKDAPVILIVEDSEDMRHYLRDHLASDYHIVEAVNGLEGLECARTNKPDLIISDVMMPEMDGYSLCRSIKADPQLNHIPVVLLTALASDSEKVVGLETGADDYIYKPFNAEALRARTENLIELRRNLRQRYSREVVAVEVSEANVRPADQVFLDRVQEIVEQHMGDTNFSVTWLADEMALSARQLQRKLKRLTNLSAAGYIRGLRLQRAAQELAKRTGTVSEIAYRVGFLDAEYFSRLFRQVYGVLPSRYRLDGEPNS